MMNVDKGGTADIGRMVVLDDLQQGSLVMQRVS